MSITSAFIIALLIESSIAFSVFTRNNEFENSLQKPTSTDTVPNVSFNFGCKCTLKGSPTPPKPEELTTPLPSQPTSPNPALPSAPQLPQVGGIPKPIPFNPEAGPQLPSVLPNLPNPNQPRPNPQQPEVLPATPNGEVKPQPFLPNPNQPKPNPQQPEVSTTTPNEDVKFRPFPPSQPFQAFQPFSETTRPGQQSIPNIEKLGSLLESLTGLDCKCNGDVAPQQNVWRPFSSGFPFNFGK